MLTYIVGFLLAMVVSAILTPMVARVGYRWGILDMPGEARKVHTRAIPRIGGIAVVLGFFVPIAGLAVYTNAISGLIYQDLRMVAALVLGSAAIVSLGVYDDLRGADAKTKLAVQFLVAIGMWVGGFRIIQVGSPFGGVLQLGMWSAPVTILWFVGVTNALNLIDGLDGLAAGVSLFAVLVLFGVSFVEYDVLLCVLTAALGGALAGFLFFNFNPAKIFLGDSGSMFLGFILAAISAWTQRKGATAVALLIPVVALGLPLLDTTLSFIRRVGRGQSPFRADREHLHHKLLALGLTHRGAVFTMYTVSAVFALGALALLDNDATRRAIALSTVTVVVILLVKKVGIFDTPAVPFSEYSASVLRDDVRAAARRVRGSRDISEVWSELSAIVERLGCEELRLAWRLSDGGDRETVFHWRAAAGEAWKLEAQLNPYDIVKRLVLEEGGRSFGNLVVLRDRRLAKAKDALIQDVALELLGEALIDFGVSQRPVASEVVAPAAPPLKVLSLPARSPGSN